MMADPLYTDADVELAAEALNPGRNAERDYYRRRAAVVLDALTAAGWRKTAWPGCTCPTAGVMFRPGCPTAHGRP
jgi:hypothetical protein